MQRSVGLMLALACLFGMSPRARAEDAPEKASYERLLREATNEFDAGAYSEAHALLARAHKLRPTARTLRGLGMASFELRHYLQAIDELDQALTETRRPLTAAQRKEVQELLERAKSYVGKLRLEVSPASAVILLDGQPVSSPQLTLDPGERVITVRADGYREEELRVTINGGEDKVIPVELAPLEPALPPEPVRAQPGPEPSPLPAAQPATARGRLAPWIVIGASAAVAVTGGVLLGLALSDKAKVEDASKGTQWSSVKSASNRVPTLSTVGIVMLGVGAAGIAAGLAWKLIPAQSRRDQSASLRVQPGGLELAGTF